MYHTKKAGSICIKMLLPTLFFVSSSYAQEPIGLLSDNYLPSTSILYNPASSFTSPIQWDINVISADIFAYNNLAYADQTSVLTLLRNSNIQSAAFNNPNTIRVFTNAMIQGPSVVFHQNSFSFGIITQVRSASSLVTKQVPSNLDFNNLWTDSLYQFPGSTSAGMNWMEVGINLGKSISTTGNYKVYSGVNINYLGGWDGITAVTDQSIGFLKHPNSDSISFSNVLMDYGYTSGFDNDVQQNLTSFQFKGSGAGLAAGVWITNGSDPENYQWKAGLSLIDVGFISFSKNIQRYQLTTDEAVTMNLPDLQGVTSVDEFTQLASETVAGNGSMVPISGPLRIWLPAALALQGEVSLPYHFYIHGLAIQRIVLSQQQVLRPNSITFTPRYETKRFAAGIPINWYDYHRVQIGGYIRLGPVVVGSDNLPALFIPAKWEGADFYLGLHLHPFKNQNSARHQTGELNCPKF